MNRESLIVCLSVKNQGRRTLGPTPFIDLKTLRIPGKFPSQVILFGLGTFTILNK
jgi:hypothetical protein